jgi:hypothetical protein
MSLYDRRPADVVKYLASRTQLRESLESVWWTSRVSSLVWLTRSTVKGRRVVRMLRLDSTYVVLPTAKLPVMTGTFVMNTKPTVLCWLSNTKVPSESSWLVMRLTTLRIEP